MFNILLAEDDVNIRQLIALYLKKDGYKVVEVNDGEEAMQAFSTAYFDLVISDIMMPKADGNVLTAFIKKTRSDCPVIILTALESFTDKKKSFTSGADDYMVKPFEMGELLLRITALLKRYKATLDKKIIHREIALDYNACTLTIAGKETSLTKKEFLVLFKLLSQPNVIFTRSQLLNEIWGYDSASLERTVDVHVTKIRDGLAKTSSVEIVSVRGLGYKAVLK